MRRVLAKLFALGAIAAAWPMSASAWTCDLTTTGSSCNIGEAWYLQMDPHPTGSETVDLTHTLDLAVADVPIVQSATTQEEAPIPEPGTGASLLAGLLGMFGVMRRRVFKS